MSFARTDGITGWVRARKLRGAVALTIAAGVASFCGSGVAFANEATTPQLAVLEDADRSLSVADVMAAPQRFRPLIGGKLNAGLTASAFWIRFDLPAVAPDAQRRVIIEAGTPIVDRVELFATAGGSVRFTARAGDDFAFAGRAMPSRTPAFVVKPDPAASMEIFLRITSDSAMAAPVRIWDEQAFAAAAARQDAFYGIYFGFLVALLSYNLFLFAATREQSYLWYVGYMASTMLLQAQLTGYTDQLIWPDHGGLANPVTFTGFAALLVSGAQFVKSYLVGANLGRQIPRVILAAQAAVFAIAASYPLLGYPIVIRLTMAATIVFMVVLVTALVVAFVRGFRPARYVLIAFGALLPGAIVHMLHALGLIPGSFYVERALELSTAAEALLLSFALAGRINAVEAQRRRAAAALGAIERRFSGALLETQEGERRRIAGELHDAIGQNLVVVGNRLRSLLDGGASERERALGEVLSVNRETLEQVRGLARDLHPPELDRLGLSVSMARMVERAVAGTGITPSLALEPIDDALASEQKIQLYRIAQEATTNAVKHSDATRLSVSLRAQGPRCELSIEDNGRGFDPASTDGGLGLATMRRRAALIGAAMTCAAGPEGGTRVHLLLTCGEAP